MPTKKGAGGKQQQFDKATGQYGNSTAAQLSEALKQEKPSDKVYPESIEELKKQQQQELPNNNYVPVVKGIINNLKTYEGKSEGTYDYLTGKPVTLTDGYMVSFHQNEPDENGHYKSHYGRYTEEEYDRLSNKFAKDNDAEMYVGVFDDEPEISFKVKTKEQALKLMIEHNQDSIWDNETAAKGDYENALIKNLKRDKRKNPLRGE